VSRITLSSNGKLVCAIEEPRGGNTDPQIATWWELDEGRTIGSYNCNWSDRISDLVITGDADKLVSVTRSGLVRATQLRPFRKFRNQLRNARLSADTNTIAFMDGGLYVIDTTSDGGDGSLVSTDAGAWMDAERGSSLLDMGGSVFANEGSVWKIEAGKNPVRIRLTGAEKPAESGLLDPNPPEPYVRSVAISGNGHRFAMAADGHGQSSWYEVWDVTSGRSLLRMESGGLSPEHVALNYDGSVLLEDSSDTIEAWSVNSGKRIGQLKSVARMKDDETRAIHDDIYCISVSPSGRIAAVSFVKLAIVNVIDIYDDKIIYSIDRLPAPVTSIAFTQDGMRLVTACKDGSIHVWDLQIGLEVLGLSGHSGRLLCVRLSTDSQRMISVSDDGSFRVWNANRSLPTSLENPGKQLDVPRILRLGPASHSVERILGRKL
jgi:WD40 repeat protein